ncbi:uncharacterized protein LOC130667949 [Microplitis mediator]|uniref:uncharacterized protein LOC130667949 n=1 Tax=Microplitis mediator TaxID=375433 RepID=UPI0025561C27|nr:uncharacterized protein LOC130667949 [Microplitis mediator]
MASYLVLKVKNLLSPNSNLCSIEGCDHVLLQKYEQFLNLNRAGSGYKREPYVCSIPRDEYYSIPLPNVLNFFADNGYRVVSSMSICITGNNWGIWTLEKKN